MTFHFWSPHFTFIWPLITLHVCNQSKLLTKSWWKPKIQSFNSEMRAKRSYHCPAKRPERMLIMAGMKSNFTIQRRFHSAFVVQIGINHIVVGIVNKAIRLCWYASQVFLQSDKISITHGHSKHAYIHISIAFQLRKWCGKKDLLTKKLLETDAIGSKYVFSIDTRYLVFICAVWLNRMGSDKSVKSANSYKLSKNKLKQYDKTIIIMSSW